MPTSGSWPAASLSAHWAASASATHADVAEMLRHASDAAVVDLVFAPEPSRRSVEEMRLDADNALSYAQIVAEDLAAGEATQTQLYNEILTQSSTVTYGQSGLSGYFPNSSPWPVIQGPLIGGSTLFSFNALCKANGGTNCGSWLLNRDLDPASNDNDPVWLDKAA